MNREGCFPRLVDLIKQGEMGDARLHRLLLEVLYEMSRVQTLSVADLSGIDDGFIKYLFQIIEELSDDANDPYHYPVIRVLVSGAHEEPCLFADSRIACLERTIYGGFYFIHSRWLDTAPSPDESCCQGPEFAWRRVHDLRREHHSAAQP